MAGFDAGEISSRITVSRDEFQRGLRAAKAEGEQFSKSTFTAKATLDIKDAEAKAAQIKARMDRLSAIVAKPEVSLQAQKAYTQLDALNAKLADLARKQPTAKVQADTAAAQAKIAALNASLDEIDRRDVEVKVKASADLLKAQAELDRLNLKLAELRLNADSTGHAMDRLGRKTDTLGQKFANTANIGGRWAKFTGPVLLSLPAMTNLLGVATGAVAAFGSTLATGGIALATYGKVAESVISQAAGAASAVQKAQESYKVTLVAIGQQYDANMAKAKNHAQRVAALTTEQKALTSAHIAELKAEGQAYAGMSPAQVALSKQLAGLTSDWHALEKSVTPAIALSVTPWLKGITDGMGFLRPVVRDVSGDVGDLGHQFDHLVNSPSFAAFARFIGVTGGQTVGAGGTAILDFLHGFIILLPQFKPLIDDVDAGITHLGQSFLSWSKSEQAREDIQGFLAWLKVNGPAVGKLLESMGGAVATLVKGFAQGGAGTEIRLLTDFFTFIEKLPKNWIGPVSDAVGTLLLLNKLSLGRKVLSIGVNFVGGGAAALLKLLSGGAFDLGGKFGGGAQKAADTQVAAAELQNKAADKNLKAAGLNDLGGGKAGKGASGEGETGPLGKLAGLGRLAAFGSIAAGLALLANALRVNAKSYGGNPIGGPQPGKIPAFYGRFGPVGSGGPVPVAVVSVPAGGGKGGAGQNFGVGPKGLGPQTLQGLDPAETAILEKIAKLYGITLPQAFKISQDANLDLRKSWDDQGKSAQQAENRVSAEAAVLKLMAGHSGEATRAMSGYTNSLRLNGAASTATIAARRELFGDLRKAGLTASQANTLIGQLSAGIHQDADNINATHPTRKSLVDDLEAAGMKASTAKGDVADYTTAVRQNGANSDQARAARKALIQDLENAGLSAKQAKTLVDKYSKSLQNIPKHEHSDIAVDAKGFWKVTGALPGGTPQGGGPHPRAARGMLVTQGMPGVDDQLILAQKGELVVPAPAVAAGAVDHLRGTIPGFAQGGVVGSFAGTPPAAGKWAQQEYATTVKAVVSATAAAAAKAVRAAIAATTVGSGSGSAVAEWARSQSMPGNRNLYAWGGTVPGAWDCSGFAGDAYEKFGYLGGKFGTRAGTSESFFNSPLLQKSGAVPGAMVFFDGVPPGHVGIVLNGSSYAGADGPQGAPNRIESLAGNVGFRVPKGGFGGGGAGPGGGDPKANAALARKMMPAWGHGAEWSAWNALEMREAGWNEHARNPSSGAYGIPQALPPSKMGAAANPPESNPRAQINWMINYIKGRYGDPIGAEAHEVSHGWYAKGTKGAAPGWAWVGEAGPELVKFHGGEHVLNSAQSMMHAAGVSRGYADGTDPEVPHKPILAAIKAERAKKHALTQAIRDINLILRGNVSPALKHQLTGEVAGDERKRRRADHELDSLRRDRDRTEKDIRQLNRREHSQSSVIGALRRQLAGAPPEESARLLDLISAHEWRLKNMRSQEKVDEWALHGQPKSKAPRGPALVALAKELLKGSTPKTPINDQISANLAIWNRDKKLLKLPGLSKKDHDILKKEADAAKKKLDFFRKEAKELRAYRDVLGADEVVVKGELADAEKAHDKADIATFKGQLSRDEKIAETISLWLGGKSKGAGSGDGSGDGGGGGGGGGGSAATPTGQFVGMLPVGPGQAGGGDFTGGGSGGLGGSGAELLGIPGATGTSSGSGGSAGGSAAGSAASAAGGQAWRITPTGGGSSAGGAGGGFGGSGAGGGMSGPPIGALGGGGDMGQMLSRLDALIAATRAVPAATGGHLGAALNGTARQAGAAARWNAR